MLNSRSVFGAIRGSMAFNRNLGPLIMYEWQLTKWKSNYLNNWRLCVFFRKFLLYYRLKILGHDRYRSIHFCRHFLKCLSFTLKSSWAVISSSSKIRIYQMLHCSIIFSIFAFKEGGLCYGNVSEKCISAT
jgi:hypothetical protein